MKRIWMGWLLFLALGSATALAQFTVTATITDTPDGLTWNDGTYRIDFYPTAAAPQLPAGTQASYSGSLSSAGAFSVVLPAVTAGGASWRFTVCPMATLMGPCPSAVLAVSSSESLSTALSAIAKSPRFPAGYGAYGYADSEAIPPATPGPGYFNVTTNSYRQWSGVSWIQVGSANSFLPLSGGTLSGSLAISNAASAPQTLLSVGGTTGQWAQFQVQESTNLIVFWGQNQYVGNSSWLTVAPSVYTGLVNLGPPAYVYGIGYSCALVSPTSGCVGGFIQAASNGVMNISNDYQGTAAVQVNVVGSLNASASLETNGAFWTAGAAAPTAACAVGSMYSNTAATSASTVLYVCDPANTWTAVTVP